jgi:hypothetical protein
MHFNANVSIPQASGVAGAHTRAPFDVQEQLMCTLKFLAVIKSRKVVWWWQQNDSRQQKVSLAQRRTGFNSHY